MTIEKVRIVRLLTNVQIVHLQYKTSLPPFPYIRRALYVTTLLTKQNACIDSITK